MKFVSRINRHFTKEFLDEMFDLYKQHKFYITDKEGKQIRVDDIRHMKSLKFREKLNDYFKDKDVQFAFLGDGTNRMAFLVDGYVFKLALDDQGYIDNLTEFKMSREAQPFVTKTYETNGLFCVAEYVTLISYDEFVKQKPRILEILDILSTEYLLGDMGWTKKNYCNWGYRKNSKDLVILDYGHMLKIDQNKLICSDCGGFLSYNSTYTEIECISCGKKYDFMTMKSKISKKEEMEMIDEYLDKSVSTSEPLIDIPDEKIVYEKCEEDEDDDKMVSNRFINFQPEEKRKRFSDIMDDDNIEEDKTSESGFTYEEMMNIVNSDKRIQNTELDAEVIPPEIAKIEDDKLRQLLLLNDNDEAFYLLSQELILGTIDRKTYDYYIDKIEEYSKLKDEEDDEVEIDKSNKSDDKKVISNTGESNNEVIEENPEIDTGFDYYRQLINKLEEEAEETSVEENTEDNKDLFTEEQTQKMNEIMSNFIYNEDDDECSLFPEDFLALNASKLGFDEEDSEEDSLEYDRVLENIKRANSAELEELEDMLNEEDDEEDTTDAYLEVYEASLKVISPEGSNESSEQISENKTETKEEKKVEEIPNVFKVRRSNSNSNSEDNFNFKVEKYSQSNNEIVVNNVNEEIVEEIDDEVVEDENRIVISEPDTTGLNTQLADALMEYRKRNQ